MDTKQLAAKAANAISDLVLEDEYTVDIDQVVGGLDDDGKFTMEKLLTVNTKLVYEVTVIAKVVNLDDE